MDTIESAMMKAMTDKKLYKQPKQESEKPNTISRGVSAILETINKKDSRQKVDYIRTDHFATK